ncbi:MAG TPA: HypC/HybG/HupF family hydrogenase formation chaperone [Pyrinomonadaceae bacterium]
MCLAIPGKIVEIVDPENRIAKVEVGGVRRNVNIGMLSEDDARVGDYVLIHVGFAMSKVDEKEAEETLRMLKQLGEYQNELEQFQIAPE